MARPAQHSCAPWCMICAKIPFGGAHVRAVLAQIFLQGLLNPRLCRIKNVESSYPKLSGALKTWVAWPFTSRMLHAQTHTTQEHTHNTHTHTHRYIQIHTQTLGMLAESFPFLCAASSGMISDQAQRAKSKGSRRGNGAKTVQPPVLK